MHKWYAAPPSIPTDAAATARTGQRDGDDVTISAPDM